MVQRVAQHVVRTRLVRDAVTDVWFARHVERTSQQRIVRLLDDDAVSRDAVAAWLRDARAAGALRHRNIAQVVEVGDPDTPYVLTRYAPVVPLADLLGARWSLEDVLEVVRPLASALDAAAAAGLPHGAVHPRSIWLDRRADGTDRRPLLSGFGLHHLLAEVAGTRGTEAPLDDFLYVAPELLRGATPTGRSDQYALAAAVHHALVGRPLFERATLSALFGAHLFAQPSLAQLGGTPSDPLDDVMARALAKDPDARFADCGAFVDALEAVQAPGAGTPTRVDTQPPTPLPTGVIDPPRRTVPVGRLVGAAAGVVALAVLALTLGQLLTRPTADLDDSAEAAAAAPTAAASADVAVASEAASLEPGVRWRAQVDAEPTALHVTPVGVLIESGGSTTVIDRETGAMRRVFPSGRGGVVAGVDRYVTDGDDGLQAVDLGDGTVRWELPVETASTPTAVDDTVYGISDADVPQLIAADADSGERLWSFPEDEVAFPADTTVAPADDFVYLADDDAVYGILPVGKTAGADTPLIDATEPASEPLCLWRHEVDEAMWTGSLRAVADGVVVANRSGTVCLRGHVEGERVWCVPVAGVAAGEPTIYEAGDMIVVVTRRAITALDARTGAQAWRQPGQWRRAVRDGDRLIAVQPDGRFAAVSMRSGALERPVDAKVGKGALIAVDGDVLYAARRNGAVLSVDLGDS